MNRVITEDPSKRTPLILGGHDFKGISDLVVKPIEAKAPKWWHIALAFSFSLLFFILYLCLFLWASYPYLDFIIASVSLSRLFFVNSFLNRTYFNPNNLTVSSVMR